MSLVALISILVAFPAPAPASSRVVQTPSESVSKGKNPAELDRTGVAWTKTFQEALERANGEHRLLFLMPDNFAPTENGAFAHECFRAGPLSDERIAGLLQLRFVPFYFNVYEGAAAYDEQAKAFVARVKKEFGKEEQSFSGGTPILFMTPKGELVGEVGPYMACDDVLAQMLKVLKKNDAYDAPSDVEKTTKDPLVRAQQLLARQDLKQAESLLAKEKSPAALLLRLKVARLSGDWKKHAKLLADLRGDGIEDHAALERALGLCHEQEFAKAVKVLAGVGDGDERHDEARYLEGVALFRAGQRDQALGVWKTLIEGRPQGPWIYRADWAYVNVLSGDAGASSGSNGGRCPSLLGREFYAGPRNPDLGS